MPALKEKMVFIMKIIFFFNLHPEVGLPNSSEITEEDMGFRDAEWAM